MTTGSVLVTCSIFLCISFCAGSGDSSPSADAGMETSSAPTVTLVAGGALDKPALYGLTRLKSTLQEAGLPYLEADSLQNASSEKVMLVGTLFNSPQIQDMRSSDRINISQTKESLAVKRLRLADKDLLVVSGADDVGLMYALLEVAEQVEALDRPVSWFSLIKEGEESPGVPVRSMAVLLHSEDCEKDWYYSRAYWQEYFALLAANRWNAFNLIFSHQTPYLSPLYAFHVKVEQHPEVKVRGLTETQQQKNLEMLQTISAMAKDYGVSFTLGIWQQIAWEGKHQGSRQDSMVSGLTRENMHSYTYFALLKLLKACPNIDTVQLRINHESGIDYDEQTEFYRNSVFKAIQDCGRPIQLENRNVGLLRETIQASLDMGIPTRVSHKYWGEHMILPYHPTRIMWTYSYGDWLKYPQKFQNLYQVWSLGSHRLFVWGDPEYVRRFAPTSVFQNADGFEICAPLSQKGYGNAPGAWRIFQDPEREFYEWEFERYWSYYMLFGRLSYNSEESDEVWLREIRKRFGKEAAPAVARAYREASRIIPLIMGTATADYNMYVWPEKDMGGLINFFLHLHSFDPLRISSFADYIENWLLGNFSAKLTPEEMARRLDKTAEACEKALEEAEKNIAAPHKEFWATQKDFQILSGMARYFAHKIRATYKLGLFYGTSDFYTLQQAIAHAELGLEVWKALSRTAEEIYYPNLVMGPGSYGHWKDNLVFVEDDLKQVQHQAELFQMLGDFDFGYDFGPRAYTDVTTIYTPWYTNNYWVEHRFQGVAPHSYFNPQQGFGWNTDARVSAEQPPNIPRELWRASNLENMHIPSQVLLRDYVQGREPAVFRIDLPEGHYQAALVFTDRSDSPQDHGPLNVSVIERFGERPLLVDAVVKKGETLVHRFNFNMTGSRYSNFRLKFSAGSGGDFILNGLTFTRIEPHIAHVPVRRTLPGQDMTLHATVTLPVQVLMPVKNSLSIARGTTSTIEPPDGIDRVQLYYSHDGGRSFKAVDMTSDQDKIFSATVPGSDVREGELLYYLQASDTIGQTVHLPKENPNQAYSVLVSHDRTPPEVTHHVTPDWEQGKPFPLEVRVKDPSGVESVILYYRQTRQAMQYSVVTMQHVGGDTYAAIVPGFMFTSEFDFMYFFETVDSVGNGIFYPDPDTTDPHLIVKVKR